MKKRMLSLLLSVVIVFSCLSCLSLVSVNALSKSEIQSQLVSILYGGSGGYITCDFDGYTTTSGRHEGIDFINYKGAPVYSLISGTVVRAYNTTSSSNLSTLSIYDEINNKSVIYLHTANITVSEGDKVNRGDLVAYESDRGISGVPHTHIEVREGEQRYASKSVNDYTLDNPDPYSYWNTVLRYADIPPTNPTISKNQVWYDLQDTVELYIHADGATSYYMSMFKDGQKIVSQDVNSGTFSMHASTYGIGNYSAYFSCSNSAGTIDSSWIDFSVVGSAGYSNIYCSKPVYDIDETVNITVETVCAKGQVIGIDKDGVGRVVTETCDSTFVIPASSLGIGSYSAYFSVYNGSGGIDTKRVTFYIAERKNLGDEFCAKIKNPSSNKYLTAVGDNVEGTDENCDKQQVWYFYRLSDNSYKIKNYYDWRAMDVDNYATGGAGTNVQVYNDWDVTAQRFYIYEVYGAYYIKPVCTDMVLDMSQTTNNLEVWGMGENWDPQKFNIEKIERSEIGIHKYTDEIVKNFDSNMCYIKHTCSVCGYYYNDTEFYLGDVNNDGTVNVLDATVIQKYCVGKATFDDELLTIADVNGDGNVNVSDATLIQKYAVGLITEF